MESLYWLKAELNGRIIPARFKFLGLLKLQNCLINKKRHELDSLMPFYRKRKVMRAVDEDLRR